LFLLAEAPETAEGGEDGAEQESEPSAVGDFDQRGREIESVEGDERQPHDKYQDGVCPPDDEGNESDEVCGYKRHENDTDAIGSAESGGLRQVLAY